MSVCQSIQQLLSYVSGGPNYIPRVTLPAWNYNQQELYSQFYFLSYLSVNAFFLLYVLLNSQIQKFIQVLSWLNTTANSWTHQTPGPLARYWAHLNAKLALAYWRFYHYKNCFSFSVTKKLVVQPILPLLDYADVVYRAASKTNLPLLNIVYNRLGRFVLGCPFITLHSVLNS